MDNKDADNLFIGVVVILIIGAILMAMGGAFKHKSPSEVKVNIYSDCMNAGGRNCNDLLR